MNLADYVLFTEYLPKSSKGTYDAISPADGVSRVVGYRRIENEPLVALASIATEAHLTAFWIRARWEAASFAILLMALGLVTFWLSRVLREEEQSKQALAKALEQNNLLLQEVHHRVKNNLQAVASLIHLGPFDARVKQDMTLRVSAMAAIHEQAYQAEQYKDVLLSEYLARLIESARRVYGDRAEIDAKLDPVVVDRDQALPIGLVANEILSNAFKHAFAPGARGLIQVSLTLKDAEHAELLIRDNGKGFDPATPATGIGSRLIRGLIAQLEGDVDIASVTGTVFRLVFKLSRKKADRTAC